jgi:hypothetical protein
MRTSARTRGRPMAFYRQSRFGTEGNTAPVRRGLRGLRRAVPGAVGRRRDAPSRNPVANPAGRMRTARIEERRRGEIGRRERLRISWRKPWGFESLRRHSIPNLITTPVTGPESRIVESGIPNPDLIPAGGARGMARFKDSGIPRRDSRIQGFPDAIQGFRDSRISD